LQKVECPLFPPWTLLKDQLGDGLPATCWTMCPSRAIRGCTGGRHDEGLQVNGCAQAFKAAYFVFSRFNISNCWAVSFLVANSVGRTSRLLWSQQSFRTSPSI